MTTIYQNIIEAQKANKKLLAVLLDPEDVTLEDIPALFLKINQSGITHVLVGGSTYSGENLDQLLISIKKESHLPVLLFPGSASQISPHADGILFLSLLSGRNPQYLIEQQIAAAPVLQKTNLEILSTAYILINSGPQTTVERISNTQAIASNNIKLALHTALAGSMMGQQLIYLEAGSGAQHPVPLEMIKTIRQQVNNPIIVGGGLRTPQAIMAAYQAGADMVVIGTAFEQNSNFFKELY